MEKQLLSVLDSSFLTVETSETPMHVAGLQIFQIPEGAPESFISDLLTAFRGGPLRPPFGLKLGGGPLERLAPSLVTDDNIDMTYHVRHATLPAPGGERELGELVSELHTVMLDRTRPLWTCHVIDGLENNRFVVYIKIHHALTDGVGAMRMITEALSADPDGASCAPWQSQPAERETRSTNKPAGSGIGLESLIDSATALGRTGLSFGRGIAGLARLPGAEPVRLPFECSPAPGLNTRVTAARRVATQQLELKRVAAVSDRSDTSINDVFLAICATALRRYLLDSDLLPSKPLIAGVPVNLRQPGEAGANEVAIIFANLATDIADPVERLMAIHASMQAWKDQLATMEPSARKALGMTMLGPSIGAAIGGVADKVRPLMNVLISNVPGPRQAMYLHGAQMEAIYPVSATLQGQSLNITCVSYNGQFNIGFTGARDALPRMQNIAVYTSEALQELEDALSAAE